MTVYNNLIAEYDDGTLIGSATTSLVAFHGATPTDQYAAITAVTTTTMASGGVGFSSSAQMLAFTTAVNAIITALKEKGLMAS